MKGKVILVGAGPGDPGLLTLNGRAALEQADVVVTDALVNPRLWQGLHAQIVDVGKRGPGAPQGAHNRLSQSGINRLLVRLANRGHNVVRLKGGDPFVFGRGSEELEALRAHKISFEVIPGVSSVYAVPAYAGIPITDRRYASHVTVLTGHERGEKKSEWNIEWDRLSPNGTLVILMGVSRWPLIQQELLSRGWPSAHPVAAIERGTTAHQRVIVSQLNRADREFKKHDLHAPAIVVVGRVAKLSRNLNWFQMSRPLLGKRIVITRPQAQAAALIEAFEKMGAHVIIAPVIRIRSLAKSRIARRILQKIANEKQSFDHLIFFSANAVRCFGEIPRSLIAQLKNVPVSAVGKQTASVARKHGWKVRFIPEKFNAAALARAIPRLRGARCLVPRAQGAPERALDGLRQRGANVLELPVYQTESIALNAAIKHEIEAGVEAIVFASPSAATGFCRNFSKRAIRAISSTSAAISMGTQTTLELRGHGFRRLYQAPTSDLQGLVRKAVQLKRSGNL